MKRKCQKTEFQVGPVEGTGRGRLPDLVTLPDLGQCGLKKKTHIHNSCVILVCYFSLFILSISINTNYLINEVSYQNILGYIICSFFSMIFALKLTGFAMICIILHMSVNWDGILMHYNIHIIISGNAAKWIQKLNIEKLIFSKLRKKIKEIILNTFKGYI